MRENLDMPRQMQTAAVLPIILVVYIRSMWSDIGFTMERIGENSFRAQKYDFLTHPNHRCGSLKPRDGCCTIGPDSPSTNFYHPTLLPNKCSDSSPLMDFHHSKAELDYSKTNLSFDMQVV